MLVLDISSFTMLVATVIIGLSRRPLMEIMPIILLLAIVVSLRLVADIAILATPFAA